MMNETLIVGYVLGALVLIASFAAVVLKVSKPIQDLNINIIKLTTVMSYITKEQDAIKGRVTQHGKEIDQNAQLLVRHAEQIRQLEEALHEHT